MNQNEFDFIVVLSTAPEKESEKIAKALVEESLVACVNVTPVKSYFRWEGKLCDEKEDLMVIKTKKEKAIEVIERIKELHSYEVPEVISIPIISGYDNYLAWIEESVK